MKNVINVVSPSYTFLKLTPNNSIRNTNTHLIARTIASLYRSVWGGIKRDEERLVNVMGREFALGTQWSIHRQSKVAYYVSIAKKRVDFHFVVPSQYVSVVCERLSDVWTGLTIEETDELPLFGDKAYKRQLTYVKEDALPLRTDRRDNDLLNSTLNVLDVMGDDDRVGILYNFIPSSQASFVHSYKSTVDKIKRGLPVERNKIGAAYALKYGIALLDDIIGDVTSVVAGRKERQQDVGLLDGLIDRLNGGRRVSEATERKANATILNTQIVVFSESNDPLRRRNNAISVCQAFDSIAGDNRLTSKEYRGRVDIRSRTIPGVEVNRCSDVEIQHFIALAGRDILERYPAIERIDTQETVVPDDLQDGVMCIGTSTYRGHRQNAYLTTDFEYRNLPLVTIGPQRAGKTNLIANLCVDAIAAGECVIVFDFIENCELSDSIAKSFPPSKVLNIVCDDPKRLQGLGYNEVGRSSDVFKQYENAKRQTSNMLALVDSINTDDSRLSPKMERYLESASLVVFINGGSIKDVFDVLTTYKVRQTYIKRVTKQQRENLSEYIDSLTELDEVDNSGRPTGNTKTSAIVGIIDRLNALKRNAYVEMMLKKDAAHNVNLVEEMQRNQVVCIRMPQSMFTTDSEKDVYTTYWMTKIWLALQVRADILRDKRQRTKVNLVVDELYQVPYMERFMASKLVQIAKFTMKPIISAHYLGQIRYLRDALRGANPSYMLIAGCDKRNYDELKDELYPYEVDDLLRLKRHHSLNYVKTKDGYGRFITELPGKVENRTINVSTNA